MPSVYVPARAVAPAPARSRGRVSERVRELAMLLALAAPAALAQQAPTPFEVEMTDAVPGAGESAADKYAVSGSFGNVSGSATGGTFSLTSGINGMPPASGASANTIFLNSFD